MRALPRPCWLLLPGRFQRGSFLGTACPVPGPPCQPGILSSPGFPSPLDREKGHQWTGLRGFQAPGRCGGGRACLSWGEEAVLWSVFLTGWPSGIAPSSDSGPPPHTPLPCITGPSVAYVLQTGPIQGLRPPVVQDGAFFSVPFCPSLWQRYFGVFASPSPDLLLRPRNGLITA